jgi:conjugal transfer/type IV secretion protein DotA/TraY
MSSILVTISMAILSFLSFKGLKPARVKIRAHAPMRSSKFMQALLPFVFALALFSAAAAPAQAAAPAGQGTFDCLGSFDWGCNVVGYLFEGQGLSTYTTGAIVNGRVVANDVGLGADSDSTSVQTALKKTMGFFSNAMLIIASLLLLYHFIVMVAETAHTGTIGGKDTNQLWAPIRLVVAIGLLVPLSTTGPGAGLNSGQYIILQIAKWGSGLGSQTWKAFAEAFAEKQTLVPSITPAVQDTITQAFSVFVCMESINYYADPSRLNRPASKIKPKWGNTSVSGARVLNFSDDTTTGHARCGSITFKLPDTSSAAGENQNVNRLVTANSQAFQAFLPSVQAKAREIIMNYFIPERISTTSPPSRTTLNQLVASFQRQLIQQTNSLSMNVANSEYEKITQSIKGAADSYGWMSAGTWFMAIARAQGQVLANGIAMPTVKGPTGIVEAGTDNSIYVDVMTWARTSPDSTADAAMGDLPTTTTPTGFAFQGAINYIGEGVGIAGTIVQALSTEFGGLITEFGDLLKGTPRQASEKILSGISNYAANYGVWKSGGEGQWDNVQSTGMVVKNINPMASLTELGHRHVQLATDLWGLAIMYAGAGVSVSTIGAAASLIPTKATNVLGAMAGLGTTMGLAAAGIIVFFSSFAFIAGVTLAFFIPLMPFVRFFYAIVTWAATLLEAMLCLPFLALAHLNPKGDGFSGQAPQFGYRMLFQLFVRPALTVFGLIASLLIFYVAVRFLNGMYYQAVLGIAGNWSGTGATGFVARVVFSIFYVTLMYISATMSFKMIDHIPQRALHWMGANAEEIRYEDAQDATLGGVSANTQGQGEKILQSPTQVGSQLKLR